MRPGRARRRRRGKVDAWPVRRTSAADDTVEVAMQIGMIGLGRMGGGMVRRLMRGGHACVVYDRAPQAVDALVKEGATGATSLSDLVSKLEAPRAVFMMLPAAFVDSTIDELAPLLESGDALVDGGNSNYQDDIARAKRLAPKGLHYVDMGTSGGVFGLERGYCLMLGGEPRGRETPGPDLRDPRSRSRRHPAHAGTRRPERHGRARLSPLRSERRGPLRQDGPQRHRVRPHGRVRRGSRTS